ncbi:PREDICTED: putative ribonuclease H protein At1g65750-like [Fragaria vesca subsp. vesca]
MGTLSTPRKEVLIKSMALAIPTYPMHCFKFPATMCKEIDAASAKFWWGQKKEKRKIYWKSWEFLGLPKSEGGLGFRKLAEFNIALLAKQVWRLHTEPNTLWAKMIKGIYYPHMDILQAGKGYRASWAWSSLLEGKALVVEGARWLVGIGNSIDIWSDKWILNSEMGFIGPNVPIPQSAPTRVSKLIDWDSYRWNLQPVCGLVPKLDMKAIEMQLFSESDIDDRLIWSPTKNGSYTVKSGYNLLHSLNLKPSRQLSHSSHRVHPSVCSTIWSIQTLPKIKHFLWQVVNNAISTYQNLYQKKIISSPLCQRCGLASETIEHTLLLCPIATCTWFACSLNYKINMQEITYIDRWIEGILKLAGPQKKLQDSCLIKISFICWELWKCRCRSLYQGIKTHSGNSPSSSHPFPSNQTHIHRNPTAIIPSQDHPTTISTLENPNTTWKKPPVGSIKINFDAAWTSDTNLAGLRVVVRNPHGSLINGSSQCCCASSAIEAEAQAAVTALSLAKKYSHLPTQIESDCQELVNIINGVDLGKNWRISPLIAQLQRAPPPSRPIDWSWIPRKANCAAHHVASLSVRKTCPDVWIDRPPSSLVHILSRDGLLCLPPEGATDQNT